MYYIKEKLALFNLNKKINKYIRYKHYNEFLFYNCEFVLAITLLLIFLFYLLFISFRHNLQNLYFILHLMLFYLFYIIFVSFHFIYQ